MLTGPLRGLDELGLGSTRGTSYDDDDFTVNTCAATAAAGLSTTRAQTCLIELHTGAHPVTQTPTSTELNLDYATALPLSDPATGGSAGGRILWARAGATSPRLG